MEKKMIFGIIILCVIVAAILLFVAMWLMPDRYMDVFRDAYQAIVDALSNP